MKTHEDFISFLESSDIPYEYITRLGLTVGDEHICVSGSYILDNSLLERARSCEKVYVLPETSEVTRWNGDQQSMETVPFLRIKLMYPKLVHIRYDIKVPEKDVESVLATLHTLEGGTEYVTALAHVN